MGGVALAALIGFRRGSLASGARRDARDRDGRQSPSSCQQVFSAQYVVWFLPLGVHCPASCAGWLGIAGLSTLMYPLSYEALWHLDPVMAVVLNIRPPCCSSSLVLLAIRLVSRRRVRLPKLCG